LIAKAHTLDNDVTFYAGILISKMESFSAKEISNFQGFGDLLFCYKFSCFVFCRHFIWKRSEREINFQKKMKE
jgi:hypothetical protein